MTVGHRTVSFTVQGKIISLPSKEMYESKVQNNMPIDE
jgi:hypothetical protein